MTHASDALPPWTHRHALINDLDVHYVEAGSGPLVVLLHGFPEFWYSWRHQISALAGAGFHVIASDLRGYNESAKPSRVSSYRMASLVADVLGLIEHVGAKSATVVGHDWGGVIAWNVAGLHPESVDKLVVLNAPHPRAFHRELRRPAQWLKSAYIFLFQIPWLAERFLSARDFHFLDRLLLERPACRGAFSVSDILLYKDALRRPGALTAALSYYRAALRYPPTRIGTIASPTLLIWGERDPYLDVGLTTGLTSWVPHLHVERLPEASHWVQNEAVDKVNRLLIDFLRDEVRATRTP